MPKNEMKSKLNEIEPGTEDFGGGFNSKAGTRSADTPKRAGYGEFQGKVKGGTKHTYGVHGENDPD